MPPRPSLSRETNSLIETQQKAWQQSLHKQLSHAFDGTPHEVDLPRTIEQCTEGLATTVRAEASDPATLKRMGDIRKLQASAWAWCDGRDLKIQTHVSPSSDSDERVWADPLFVEVDVASGELFTNLIRRGNGQYLSFLPSASHKSAFKSVPVSQLVYVPLTSEAFRLEVGEEPTNKDEDIDMPDAPDGDDDPRDTSTVLGAVPDAVKQDSRMTVLNSEDVLAFAREAWASLLHPSGSAADIATANVEQAAESLQRGFHSLCKDPKPGASDSKMGYPQEQKQYEVIVGGRSFIDRHETGTVSIALPAWQIRRVADRVPVASSYTHHITLDAAPAADPSPSSLPLVATGSPGTGIIAPSLPLAEAGVGVNESSRGSSPLLDIPDTEAVQSETGTIHAAAAANPAQPASSLSSSLPPAASFSSARLRCIQGIGERLNRQGARVSFIAANPPPYDPKASSNRVQQGQKHDPTRVVTLLYEQHIPKERRARLALSRNVTIVPSDRVDDPETTRNGKVRIVAEKDLGDLRKPREDVSLVYDSAMHGSINEFVSSWKQLLNDKGPKWADVGDVSYWMRRKDEPEFERITGEAIELSAASLARHLAGGAAKRMQEGSRFVPRYVQWADTHGPNVLVHTWAEFDGNDHECAKPLARSIDDPDHTVVKFGEKTNKD